MSATLSIAAPARDQGTCDTPAGPSVFCTGDPMRATHESWQGPDGFQYLTARSIRQVFVVTAGRDRFYGDDPVNPPNQYDLARGVMLSDQTAIVPEPSTSVPLGIGLLLFCMARRAIPQSPPTSARRLASTPR